LLKNSITWLNLLLVFATTTFRVMIPDAFSFFDIHLNFLQSYFTTRYAKYDNRHNAHAHNGLDGILVNIIYDTT